MTSPAAQTSSRPVLTAAEPQLFVSDIKAAFDFFTAKLGFSVVYVYGEPPFYGQVKRDDARLNLRHVDGPLIDPILRNRQSLLSASITVGTVEDIKQLFLEFQAAGVTFAQPLKDEPWGAQDFIVQGPDGNLVLFAGPAK